MAIQDQIAELTRQLSDKARDVVYDFAKAAFDSKAEQAYRDSQNRKPRLVCSDGERVAQ
jgi:hypothetical protein